jgi:propanol-preferring alcohol dehydrogenase
MRAMVVPAWGQRSELREVPEPNPGPDEAVMKVRAAGVGLTLLNMRTGRSGGTTPRIMGHELAGDIVAVGDGVRHVKPGDRCTVYFYLTCGHCRRCRGGRETLCENWQGHVGVHVDGGFADLVCLPAGNFLSIPPALDYEAAAMAADAVNTNLHCMRERARIGPADQVVLIGAGGGVGIHGVQMAKLFGARVIAVDVSEEKLELARTWGADDTINARAVDDLASAIMKATDGRGADATVDYVGRTPTFQAAVDSLAVGGRAVAIGAMPDGFRLDTRRLVQGERVVTGSRHSTRAEFIETLEIMARGAIKPVVGTRAHFTEVERLFDLITSERLLGRGALTYES